MDYSKVKARETPLCVQHFLEYANALPGHAYHGTTLTEADMQPGATPSRKSKRTSSSVRRQPARAAKNPAVCYSEDSTSSKLRKLAADQPDVESSEASSILLPNDGQYPQPGGELQDVSAHVASVVQQGILRSRKARCFLGPKPQVCDFCTEVAANSTESATDLDPASDHGRRGAVPTAIMGGPVHSLADLLDWHDIDVPDSHLYEFRGTRFVIDACQKPMIVLV